MGWRTGEIILSEHDLKSSSKYNTSKSLRSLHLDDFYFNLSETKEVYEANRIVFRSIDGNRVKVLKERVCVMPKKIKTYKSRKLKL